MNNSIPVLLANDLARPAPIYDQLAQALRTAITNRKLKPGSALPDERELAASLKLSRGTVRRALATLVQEKLIVRQHGRGNFVAQPQKLPALPLAVVFEFGASLDSSTYLGQIVQSMAHRAGQLGAELLLRDSSATRSALEPAAQLFIMTADRRAAQKAATRGPVISVDTIVHGAGIDSVVYDNVEAYADATRRVLALGHRRIACTHVHYLRGGRRVENPNSDERMEGYRRAMGHAGLPELVWSLPHDLDVIAASAGELLTRDAPTAVVAFDDTIARAVKLAADAIGLKVPRELSIVTIQLRETMPKDGVDWSGPVVSQAELSRKAVERAVQRVENGSLAGELIKLPWSWHAGATLMALPARPDHPPRRH